MKRAILFFIVFISCSDMVWAQIDAQFSQYFIALGYYNPAYAGTSDKLNTLAMYRQQWAGIEGAPKSFFITADMPFSFKNTKHGVGVTVYNDQAGLFRHTVIGLQYAYKYKLFGGVLSGGIQLGMANLSFDADGIYIPDISESPDHTMEDEAIPTSNENGMGLDMNAGLFYSHRKFYVGVGIMHLSEAEIGLDENISTYIPRTYNFVGGYNIQLRNPLIELQPSVFLKTDMQYMSADITARLIYNKMFNGGLSWRVNESVILLLGANIKNFQAGYAYDFPTTAIRKGSSGSHELFLRFSMNLKKTKTGQYRHKSVRIL
ncbi:MAG: type IX secretion system membrane protein PorP/SprF [Tannerellaceae bacterium]|nr:type IX secretion system membrane protein PorP/SprF [Tannerellaceae bacterium]